jgi:renalase
MRIAIVGAGIAGLSCAHALQTGGHTVRVFDKGRGPGGRMATRRVDTAVGTVAFDHGAQYFTARDPAFVQTVAQWSADGVAARWPAAGEDAWVGTPGMNALVKAIAQDLDVAWNSRVEGIVAGDGGWRVDPVSDGVFDAVVVATPAEQAVGLLEPHDPAMAAAAQGCPSEPCWTAMVAFAERISVPADVLRDRGIIGWAARNSAKPGRDGPEAWVIQGNPDWSRAHLEDAVDGVVDSLLSALAAEAEAPLPEATVRIGHRWRYARVRARDDGAVWDANRGIGAVGDWLLGPRVESAWLSGRKLADQILAPAG